MIIEQIVIKNWRGYRETHTFRFQEGVNILLGRNEAGKSTLFEALTRVLFDRHNSKTEEIRAIQPIGSSLGPEAHVQFRANEQRYRAEKRFLQEPRSALFSERGGKWELDHEGDEADAKLREILRGEGTSRMAARSEHRGLAQALWYLQTDGPIPEKTWSEGVKQGLQGLVELAARSPAEAAVLERIKGSYGEFWTPTGRVVSNSELGRMEAELPELEEQLALLVEKTRSTERYRADLEESQSSEIEKRAELEKAQAELGELSTRVQEVESLERERETRQREAQDTEQEFERLQGELSKVKNRQETVRERKADMERLEQSLAEARVTVRTEESARDRHGRRWKEELEPRLQTLESELQALRALERMKTLERERSRLEKHLHKVTGIKEDLGERRRERADLVAPTAKEWKWFGTASQELSVLQAQVEASAVRVAFEWTEKTRNVATRPSIRAGEDGEYLVAEPTEFHIEDVGKVRVRSGASALKDLVTKRDEVDQEIRRFLTRFAVTDADGVAELHEMGRELDNAISALQYNLKDTERSVPDAEEELARVKREIEQETRSASNLPRETRDQDEKWIRDQIAQKERDKARIIKEIEEEQEAEKTARTRHLELVESLQGTQNKLAEHTAEISINKKSINEILEPFGTVDNLKKLSVAAMERAKNADAELKSFLSDYEERVVTPKRLHDQASKRVRELDAQLTEISKNIAATLARIEESAAQGNYSQLADLQIEVEWKKRRLEVLRARAEGAKLLHNLVEVREKERSAALSGPIQNLVNGWLRLLTEDFYDALQIDHDLKPTGVHMARYSEDLPLGSLSHGAKEQVVVLLRLGIAVLVSDPERNLVVIDDRLVNADPVRMKRLCLILKEAAEACQIVIATCNDTPYAGIGAHLLRVPSDGTAAEESAGA